MPAPEPLINALVGRLRSLDREFEPSNVIRELGWALVTEGQLYLRADEDDSELFFETFGYPRQEDPSVWVDRVARGLQERLPAEEWVELAARSVQRAAERYISMRESSSEASG
jgi:hypothetical protein